MKKISTTKGSPKLAAACGPKAQDRPAQGKRGTSAALGFRQQKEPSPKGARQKVPSGSYSALSGLAACHSLTQGVALGWLILGLWPARQRAAQKFRTGFGSLALCPARARNGAVPRANPVNPDNPEILCQRVGGDGDRINGINRIQASSSGTKNPRHARDRSPAHISVVQL